MNTNHAGSSYPEYFIPEDLVSMGLYRDIAHVHDAIRADWRGQYNIPPHIRYTSKDIRFPFRELHKWLSVQTWPHRYERKKQTHQKAKTMLIMLDNGDFYDSEYFDCEDLAKLGLFRGRWYAWQATSRTYNVPPYFKQKRETFFPADELRCWLSKQTWLCKYTKKIKTGDVNDRK